MINVCELQQAKDKNSLTFWKNVTDFNRFLFPIWQNLLYPTCTDFINSPDGIEIQFGDKGLTYIYYFRCRIKSVLKVVLQEM